MASRSRREPRIAEYQVSQRPPVKFAILGKDAGAEPLDRLAQARRARRDHLRGRLIGVDDRDAKLRESLGNRALAAGDAAGKADAQAAPPWLSA